MSEETRDTEQEKQDSNPFLRQVSLLNISLLLNMKLFRALILCNGKFFMCKSVSCYAYNWMYSNIYFYLLTIT